MENEIIKSAKVFIELIYKIQIKTFFMEWKMGNELLLLKVLVLQ